MRFRPYPQFCWEELFLPVLTFEISPHFGTKWFELNECVRWVSVFAHGGFFKPGQFSVGFVWHKLEICCRMFGDGLTFQIEETSSLEQFGNHGKHETIQSVLDHHSWDHSWLELSQQNKSCSQPLFSLVDCCHSPSSTPLWVKGTVFVTLFAFALLVETPKSTSKSAIDDSCEKEFILSLPYKYQKSKLFCFLLFIFCFSVVVLLL